ncbi:hypothetical protein SAMN05444392_11672 [Seinonella peptonophila]|uniref:Uncharacterized protein n=1 Tax=Seinonella peptonophila TaxID=112248 RepID=A0A1M5AY17_9BACL|nr:hypothetical protein [Seinonella peptonophila]SHF35181.1 hypothetical protein SAMN05444392_11672 [Seinonella peptonophila]
MFQPANQVKRYLKMVIYGKAGVGKTLFALKVPGRKAVINTGNETDFYRRAYSFDVKNTCIFRSQAAP